MNRPPPAPADPAGDRQPHRLRRKGPDPRTRLDQHVQRDPRPRCSQRCEACSSLVGSRATRSLTGGPSQVDMLLLAGDLFHENRPSRTSLYQTISAMRERCLGDRPISLELISDAGVGIARDARCARTNLRPQTRFGSGGKEDPMLIIAGVCALTAGRESITKTKTSTSGCPSFRFTGTTTTRRASARCGGFILCHDPRRPFH